MNAKPECIVCALQQALNTARVVSEDPLVHLDVLHETARYLADVPLNQTPAALSKPVYDIVSRVTGVRDPFARLKQQTNKAALRLLPALEERVRKAHDPLKAAVHLAVAGNIIDLGIGHAFDLSKDVVRILGQRFAVEDLPAFRRDLHKAHKLVYLGDNAGEIVFDRVLIQILQGMGLDVTFVVKSEPIINDATMADAVAAGLPKLCTVIETGSADIGVNWKNVSSEFRRRIRDADLVLAKGHGNFETCTGQPGTYYFLLKAKCAMVAEELGVRVGDIVFKREKN